MIKDFITINRIYQGRSGTFGVIHDFNNIPFALTGELPWNDNQRSKSCIPSGDYVCSQWDSSRFGTTFQIENVPDRTYILFHKGNKPLSDSKGCILIGEQFGTLSGNHAILSSKQGFSEFMSKVEGYAKFKLRINNLWSF